MAYGFGTGVQAGLGATDYSNYLRGALAGAEMSASGQAGIAQGIASAGQQINALAQQYMQKKEKREKEQMAVAAFQNIASANPDLAKQLGVNPNDPQAVKYIVNGLGIAESISLASLLDKMNREAKQTAAFQAGISAIPETITEEVAVKTIDTDKLTKPEKFTAPTSFLVATPEQSVEDFMDTGKITPQAPAMAIDMVSKQPAAPAAAPEAPAIKPVPKNIEQYFVLNPVTGALLPTQQLNKETNEVKSALSSLDVQKKNIEFTLEKGFPTNIASTPGAPEEPTYGVPLRAERVREFNERLAQIEQRESLLKEELVRLENVRQSAADFRKQLDKKPSVEETASNVIDRSLRFAEEVNLDPVDKNQWLQMKTVLKDIPRKATDGEKIAAFVKAYGDIAPIDPSVYFKMKQLFDTTPVITDLGGGNQLVTVGGQSFVIGAGKEGITPASSRKLDNQEGYAKLLTFAKNIGADEFIAKHPQLYNKLEELHVLYGDRNPFTNIIFPLRQAIAALSEQPATNTATTPTGSSIQLAANEVLKNQPVRR